MITNLPEEIQEAIMNHLHPGKRRLLNSSVILPEYITRQMADTIRTNAMRITLATLLKKHINKLFTTLDAYLHSYTYSLCNYGSLYLSYNDECLMFAPKHQHNPCCRFCGKYKAHHKYWKMMNVYFQLKFIF